MTADLPDRSADREREALKLIARGGCHVYVGTTRCSDPAAKRIRGDRRLSSGWCDACIAADALAARPAPDDREARIHFCRCSSLGLCAEHAAQDAAQDAAPSSPGSGDALHGKLAKALRRLYLHVGGSDEDWHADAVALLPVVREAITDELLWAATEAECHHDLVMLKRRAADALRGHQEQA